MNDPRLPPLPVRATALLSAFALMLAGCVVNPVTGRTELSVMSPAQEATIGRDAAAQVEQQIGLVANGALVVYVSELGQRLARMSPRRDVQYRFFVADMAEANAFALPGGYVYVSRGLLALTNSEDELANVIGHEIGHVAARHAAQRQTRALGVGLLAALGTLAAGALGGASAASSVSEIGQVVGAGLIAAYGRDQEHQADEVGQGIAARAGWDPAGMSSFLQTLHRDSERQVGGPRLPSFLDSHPSTQERVMNTAARARYLAPQRGLSSSSSRALFLSRIEGIVVGPSPADGVFQGALFLHPGLDFSMHFPDGWKTQNTRSAVLAVAPQGDGVILLELQGKPTEPARAAVEFARANDLILQNRRSLRVGGLAAYEASVEIRTSQGTTAALLTWIAHPRGTFRISGMSPLDRFSRHAARFAASAGSFRVLEPVQRRRITERRLGVVRARSGETLAALAAREQNAWSVEETAIANALEPQARLAAGQLVKIAREVPYRR